MAHPPDPLTMYQNQKYSLCGGATKWVHDKFEVEPQGNDCMVPDLDCRQNLMKYHGQY